tara:strand:+ start:885 stop:1457 length:573 start_codon:yes stop_codon:yes gene_type:complete
MKKIILNFLEIGKIDRGLFRIWILATAFVLFATIDDYYSSYDTKKYKQIKNMKCIYVTEYLNTKSERYKKTFNKTYLIPKIGGVIYVERKKKNIKYEDEKLVYKEIKENDFIYLKSADIDKKKELWDIGYPIGRNHFIGLEVCEKQLNKKILAYKKNLNFLLSIAAIPIWVVFGWFFFKKIFLWIVRGFK